MPLPSLSVRLAAEPVRSVAFGSISGAYMGIGTSLANPARLIYLLNTTNGDLMISLDGINDHFPIINNGYMILDICSNTSVSQAWFIAQGTRFYVKEITAPTSGSIYLSVFYGGGTI